MKILLAVDASKTSLDAVKFVIKHADWFREALQLELVNAHVEIPVARLPGMHGIGKAQLRQFHEEESKKELAGATRLLDEAGVRYETRVVIGPSLAEAIVKHAANSGSDLIVIGAPQAIIGSVSSKVMHLAEVPVLMVK